MMMLLDRLTVFPDVSTSIKAGPTRPATNQLYPNPLRVDVKLVGSISRFRLRIFRWWKIKFVQGEKIEIKL